MFFSIHKRVDNTLVCEYIRFDRINRLVEDGLTLLVYFDDGESQIYVEAERQDILDEIKLIRNLILNK